MNYNLSLLLEKNNLEVTQQPYDLQMAEADSKLVLSMSLNVSNRKLYIYVCNLTMQLDISIAQNNLFLQILKYEQPEPISEEDEDDHDINQLNKRIERQESNNSNVLSSSGKQNDINITRNFFYILKLNRTQFFL